MTLGLIILSKREAKSDEYKYLSEWWNPFLWNFDLNSAYMPPKFLLPIF